MAVAGAVVGRSSSSTEPQSMLRKAAHDLRTPLTTVLQSVDALLDLPDETSERARILFDVLRRNVYWMGQVLDASTSTAVAAQRLDLRKIVSDMRALICPLLAVRQQTLALGGRGGSYIVRGEYALLARALLNLIENASKYGPLGDEIRVRVSRRGSKVFVSVSDHGPGIARGQRHAVFGAFYRTQEVRDAGYVGRGLGLAVVKEVVESHGGAVGVSRVSKETRVWFWLPAVPVEAVDPAA